MAKVQRIKCYWPNENRPVFQAQCDTVVGQISAEGVTEDECMANLKIAVEGKKLEYPQTEREETDKNSSVYKLVL
jgi:hypothetical protein